MLGQLLEKIRSKTTGTLRRSSCFKYTESICVSCNFSSRVWVSLRNSLIFVSFSLLVYLDKLIKSKAFDVGFDLKPDGQLVARWNVNFSQVYCKPLSNPVFR